MLNGVLLRVFLKGKTRTAVGICARIKQECRYVEVLPCFTSNIYCGSISKSALGCSFTFLGALHIDQVLLSISII